MSDENNSTPEEFGQMTWLLMTDVMRCRNELHKATTKEDQAFWKRAFTRSVFAFIEGFIEFFRSSALNFEFNKLYLGISSGEYPAIELGLLSVLGGDSFSMNEDGTVKSQRLKTPFLQNLLFCFNRYAKVRGVHVRIKKEGQWEKILSAVRVRDGLMHPKSPNSIEISDEKIEDVVYTLKWFYQQFHSVIKKGSDNKEFPLELFTLKLKKL